MYCRVKKKKQNHYEIRKDSAVYTWTFITMDCEPIIIIFVSIMDGRGFFSRHGRLACDPNTVHGHKNFYQVDEKKYKKNIALIRVNSNIWIVNLSE